MWPAAVLARVRELHAAGLCDREVADRMRDVFLPGTAGNQQVGHLRGRRLGLPVTHLRLVWDSAAGTVTGYAASPGQPEEMIGRFADQWTPYSSSACLGGFDLGGEAFTGFSGSTVVTAENLTEACGGGMLMARSAGPAPVPLPCVHEGHTRPGPNGPDGRTYLGCDAGMGDPPGTVCRCACGPGCPGYEADG